MKCAESGPNKVSWVLECVDRALQEAKRAAEPLFPPPWRDAARRFYRRQKLNALRHRLIQKPTDPRHLEILRDHAFQASVAEVKWLTLADTARLANLWQLCRLSDPGGILVEVGAYKGGTALHLSNCRPEAEIVVCDTFSGYRDLPMDPVIDERELTWRQRFGSGPFEDTSVEAVRALFAARRRRVTIIEGPFPASDTAEGGRVRDVAFAHIDVTLYRSCRETLEYMRPRSRESAIWVVDSYLQETPGVTLAANEFAAEHPDWALLPMYPGQAVLFHWSRR